MFINCSILSTSGCLVRVSAGIQIILAEVSGGFPQSLQITVWIVPLLYQNRLIRNTFHFISYLTRRRYVA
jgi:hypothetical protein